MNIRYESEVVGYWDSEEPAVVLSDREVVRGDVSAVFVFLRRFLPLTLLLAATFLLIYCSTSLPL